jgi:hypothetical protein
MMYRISLGALALALFVSAPILVGRAADKTDTHDGKVVSVADSKLVMTGKDGKEHSHSVAADAKVTCDGTACKLLDLKAGLRIRVTTKTGDRDMVTRIEALNKNEQFAQAFEKGANPAHLGKVVSVKGDKLVLIGKSGKEYSHTVAADAKISCDGVACKLAALESGWRIRVTTTDKNVVTQIEALNKNESFPKRN